MDILPIILIEVHFGVENSITGTTATVGPRSVS